MSGSPSGSGSGEVVLSGDFVEIYNVTDLGQSGETEELLGHSHDDLTLSRDNEVVEVQAHSQANTIRSRTHRTEDFEVSVYLTPGIPELEQLGIVDADGNSTGGGVTWANARVYVYADAPDAAGADTPQEVFEFTDVDWDFSEFALSVGDVGNFDFMAFLNGGWSQGKTSSGA